MAEVSSLLAFRVVWDCRPSPRRTFVGELLGMYRLDLQNFSGLRQLLRQQPGGTDDPAKNLPTSPSNTGTERMIPQTDIMISRF